MNSVNLYTVICYGKLQYNLFGDSVEWGLIFGCIITFYTREEDREYYSVLKSFSEVLQTNDSY